METPVTAQRHRQRYWKRRILISTLVGGLAGFLISYLFPPKYTSRSLIYVQQPRGDVWGTLPVQDYKSRLAIFQQQALTANQSRPIIQRLGISKTGEKEKVVDQIRRNMRIEPAFYGDVTVADSDAVQPSQIVGFDLIYTDASPQRAEQLCNGLTSVLLEEGRAQRRKSQDDTTEFLQRQVEEAKDNLETIHDQLASGLANRGSRTVEAQASDQKLAHDYKRAQASYAALLGKLRQMKGATQISHELEAGEPMSVLLPCSHPDSADSPDRLLFASSGFGAGLLLANLFVVVSRPLR